MTRPLRSTPIRGVRPPARRRGLQALVLVLVLVSLACAGVAPAAGSIPAQAAGPLWAVVGQPDVAAAEQDSLSASGQSGEVAEGTASSVDLFLEVYDLLLSTSVARPDPSFLIQSAINGMVAALRDNYANYFPPAAMASFESEVRGTFGGVGVRVTEDEDGYLVVVNVLPGYAAERAGIKPADRIIAVDGQTIVGRGLLATDLIRGEPGTKVVLTITREGVDGVLNFELLRELISNVSVDWKVIEGKYGYVQVTTFDEDTSREFDYALQDLAAKGAQGLILDLRGNPGGLVDTCVRVAERLLPDRAAIIRINWVDDVDVIRAHTDEDYTPLAGIPYKENGAFPWPVAVLVDGGTASASEIFAAALQEAGVARVFGEKTYGKGCIQTLYTLSTGGGLRLTTAYWTTGQQKPIDGVGVTPDEVIRPVEEPEEPREPSFVPVTDRWAFKLGAMGSDVVVLQARLEQLGYDPGAQDGVFWLRTEQALKEFQRNAGVPVTGVTDATTVEALNTAKLADHPAGKPAAPTGGPPGTPGSAEPSAPPVPEVTGDNAIDRAIQWLGEGGTP